MKPSFFTTYVFQNTRLAWFWFLVRVYLGWEWLSAGYEKIINPVWVGSNAGGALTGFIKGALLKTGGLHPDVQGWYASFLSHMVLPHAYIWSHFVAVGEVMVGLGLIVGCLTTTAAFFGFFMNLNYLLSGTVDASTGLPGGKYPFQFPIIDAVAATLLPADESPLTKTIAPDVMQAGSYSWYWPTVSSSFFDPNLS
jgi:uncharacterized membrane protein YphA (DoxX/SURF4 family)